ncbi:hypothetical protein ACFXJ5_09275 [Streptomyces sp. NPDC059373]
MKRFTPRFQGGPWPDGARVLHVYVLPEADLDTDLIALAAACRTAMAPYPIRPLPDGLLHVTVEMVADTTSDKISATERDTLADSLRSHLDGVAPFQVMAGSPIANRAGALLDLTPDADLLDLRSRVRGALVAARGPQTLQHQGGRHHLALGYAGAETDSDPLQSALRSITPSHAPLTIGAVHLLDVGFREHPDSWELSWDPVATIALTPPR